MNEPQKLEAKHQTIRGKIIYLSHKAERMNVERGREYFTLTKQADGLSILHAHCEIDDAPNVIRDVTASFETATMRPQDGYVRISVGNKYEGSGWFRFTEKAASCETFNKDTGRETTHLDITAPTSWFGHHAIVNDGFLSRFFPLEAKPGKQRLKHVMMSSPDHRGATGPILFPLSFGVVYVGDESITIGAGTFEARKFEIVDTAEGLPEEHPPYQMWCTKDEDGLFLKGGVQGYMQTYYELVELIR